jgi:hypothetical protein
VRAIRPKLAALIAKQPSKLRVRAQLTVWKLRYRLTELRMGPHGKQIEFIAKVNPDDKLGSAEEAPLGAELQKAEFPRTGFYYRGDDEWRPGDSFGSPSSRTRRYQTAQELIGHVHPKAKNEKSNRSRQRRRRCRSARSCWTCSRLGHSWKYPSERTVWLLRHVLDSATPIRHRLAHPQG